MVGLVNLKMDSYIPEISNPLVNQPHTANALLISSLKSKVNNIQNINRICS